MTHFQVPHLSPNPKMPQSDPLLLGYLSKCPFCHKSCHIHGGGVKNHIWKSPMCQRKHSQMLKSLAARAVQCTHTSRLHCLCHPLIFHLWTLMAHQTPHL